MRVHINVSVYVGYVSIKFYKNWIKCQFFSKLARSKKFTQILNQVQSVPNRLDSVDALEVVLRVNIQLDDLLVAKSKWFRDDVNDVDVQQNLCTKLAPPKFVINDWYTN